MSGILGALYGIAAVVLLLLIVLLISVGWAVLVIWALNVLGLHVAYGAGEVIAVLILSDIFGKGININFR